MNIIDIGLVLILAIAVRGGYKRGFFKELYDLLVIIITVAIAYLLKDFGASIATKFDYNSFFHLSLNEGIYDLLISIMAPVLGFTLIFIIVWIILKPTVYILIEKNKLPNNMNYQWGGATLAGLKTIVYFTVVAFVLSFATITKYENIYNNSFLLEPLLKINQPLYESQKQIIQIYEDAKVLSSIIKNQDGKLTNTKELVAIIKKVKDNPVITDDLIASVSKTVINNTKAVDLTNVDISTFTTNIKNNENYPLLKTLYDEEVITDSLIVKVLEINNVTGITEEDVKKIFE